MAIFPSQSDPRLVGTVDLGSFTADEDGSLGEKLQNILDNSGGISRVAGSGYQTVPSASDGITISVASSSWVNTAYSEITSGLGAAVALMGVAFNQEGSNEEGELEIAIGAAGSESPIAVVTSTYGPTDRWFAFMFPLPYYIDASTRIAVRGRGDVTPIFQRVKLIYVEQGDLV